MALSFNTEQNETIAAIATGLSESGIGIIRVSGPEALAIGDKLYRNKKSNSKVSSWKANTIHFGYIVDPGRPGEPVLDEVMVSIMRAPHSYTTEDTIEINCHGGVYLMQRVLQLVLANGARMAEPGEFTKRAFLGGRIDLSQAEAVMDLIESSNEFSRKTALAQLRGSVSGTIQKLRSEILYELAFIESALDDPENYSLDGYPMKLKKRCSSILSELNRLLEDSRNGRILREGIRTVIVGKPNAGKSSLLNYLSGEERAIVTDIAGTTRDTVEEKVRLGDLVLNLTDTAGIRQTQDRIEKIGVDKAIAAMASADLILFLIDRSSVLDAEDREIAALIQKRLEQAGHTGTGGMSGMNCQCLVLLNKSDLEPLLTKEEVQSLFPGDVSPSSYLCISAVTGEGMDDLVGTLTSLFHSGQIHAENEVLLSGLRQQQEVQAAADAIRLVIQSIDQGLSEDFFSIDLMTAYTELGKVLGEAVEDDLVEEIFSRFCLGK